MHLAWSSRQPWQNVHHCSHSWLLTSDVPFGNLAIALAIWQSSLRLRLRQQHHTAVHFRVTQQLALAPTGQEAGTAVMTEILQQLVVYLQGHITKSGPKDAGRDAVQLILIIVQILSVEALLPNE